MNTKTLICFLVMTLMVLLWAQSQPPLSVSFRFQKYSADNGLPGESVKSIHQDRDGFMWLGVEYEGLVRFDGTTFDTFRHDEEDSTTISSNIVKCIAEDRYGRLFVGTKDGLNVKEAGIDRIRAQRFERHYHATSPGLPANEIIVLHRDLRDNMLVGTAKGLTIALPEGQFQEVDLGSEHSFRIQAIYEDRSALFVGTDQGLFKLNSDYEVVWQASIPSRENLNNSNIKTLVRDHQGRLWVGTRRGIYIFNPDTKRFYPINQFLERGTHFSSVGIDSFYRDSQDRIWVGTISEGLCLFYPVDGHFELLSHPHFEAGGMRGDQVRSIFQDKQGLVWISVKNDGLYLYNDRSETFSYLGTNNLATPLSDDAVLSVHESSLGELYVGTRQGGLNVLGVGQSSVKHLKRIYENRGMASSRVEAIDEDASGNIWIATTSGLSLLNKHSSRFTNYFFMPIDDICITRDDRIWVGTAMGLYRFDRGLKQFVPYPVSAELEPFLKDVLKVYEAREGELLLATANSGLFRIDVQGGECLRYYSESIDPSYRLISDEVRAIHQDETGIIWLGTKQDGLFAIDRDRRTVKAGPKQLNTESVFSILSDEEGNLWLATNQGICKHLPQTGEVVQFGEEYGLQGKSFIRSAFYQSPDGTMFFGGNNGLNFFQPSSVKKKLYKPSIAIRSIETLRGYPIPKDGNLWLFNHNDHLSIDFSLIDYSSPQRNKYAYKLKGLGADWIQCGHRNQVFYGNLKPGDYTFMVKGVNGDGVWSDVAQMPFRILPPWWQTVWAQVVEVLIFMFLLYFIFRIFTFRTRKQQELRMMRMEKEQTEKITQYKLRFFTNISHELRTPLTMIVPTAEKLAYAKSLPVEQIRTLSHTVYKNASWLNRMVDELIEFREIDQGQLKLKPRRVDICHTCQEVCEEYHELAEANEMAISFFRGEGPTTGWFDERVVRKVVGNLISNAIKYSPTSSQVDIKVESMEERKGSGFFQVWKAKESIGKGVKISVADKGVGISQKDLPYIFDRFFRSEDHSNISGSGIGLDLTKSLVEHHGGRISVSSKEGEGSVFSVELPLEFLQPVPERGAPVDLPKKDFLENRKAIAAPSLPKNEKPFILIADDNLEIQQLIKSMLPASFVVRTVSNGEEAYREALRIPQPNLIIADIMMPVMDGYDLCVRVKSNFKSSHIPLLLLTAKATHQDHIAGFRVGADAYLTKPFRADLLVARVHNLLERQQRLRHLRGTELAVEPSEPPAYSLEKELLRRCLQVVEENISDSDFSVEHLAREIGLSRTQLFRKLKYQLGQNPREFISAVRIKRAIALMKQKSYNLSEIAYKTGFSSPSSFSITFKKHRHVSPTDYINSYLK